MSVNNEVGEAKLLRWLANNFQYIENPKDEIDKMNNAIHIYCTAGADKIDSLSDELTELKELLKSKGEINHG